MIDVPDLDLQAMLCDMYRDGVETGTMTFTPVGRSVPVAAIILVVGANTSYYLNALEEAQAEVLFYDVWPH